MESGGGRGKGRPVRCPKCDDLLPDLADLTAHRCCGRVATFRGEKNIFPFPVKKKVRVNKDAIFTAIHSRFAPSADSPWERNSTGFNSREEQDRLGLSPEAACRRRPASGFDDGVDGRRAESGSKDGVSRLLRDSTSRSDDAMPVFCRTPEDKMRSSPLPKRRDERSKKTNQSRIHEAEFPRKDSLLLLRQLDELRDHISRSSEFVGKPISPEFMRKPRERVGVAEAYSSGLNNDHGYSELYVSQGMHKVPYINSFYSGRSRKEHLHRQFDAHPLSSRHSDEFDHQHRKYKLLPERVTPRPITNESHGVYPLGIQVPRMQEHNEKLARAATSKTKKLHPCRAFAGATPFVICSSCFELLKLPQVILLVSKKLSKLRCGSCSEVFCIELTGNRLLVSSCSPIPEAIDSSHVKVNRHEQYKAQTSTNSDVSSISEEHGVPCQIILPTDGNRSSHLTSSRELMERESTDLTYPEKLKGISVASDGSENVENPESMIVSDVADLSIQDNLTFSLSSQKGISESGSKKEHSDEEITISNSDKFDQSSQKEEAITEIDLSVKDYSISSQDYHGIEKHRNQTFIDKTDHSLVLNTSLRDTPRINLSARDERSQVWVNGHPIPDHLVWKAEKKAGTIAPGEYW